MNALIVITLIINKLSNNYKIMDKTEIMGLNLLNNDCLIEKNELYAKYYNDTSKAKIVDCKSKEWTGRILMQYIDSTNLTFILIENMFQ